MIENKTYAKGRVVELNEEIEVLLNKIKPLQKEINHLSSNEDDLNTSSIRNLCDKYDALRKNITQKWIQINELKKIWGF